MATTILQSFTYMSLNLHTFKYSTVVQYRLIWPQLRLAETESIAVLLWTGRFIPVPKFLFIGVWCVFKVKRQLVTMAESKYIVTHKFTSIYNSNELLELTVKCTYLYNVNLLLSRYVVFTSSIKIWATESWTSNVTPIHRWARPAAPAHVPSNFPWTLSQHNKNKLGVLSFNEPLYTRALELSMLFHILNTHVLCHVMLSVCHVCTMYTSCAVSVLTIHRLQSATSKSDNFFLSLGECNFSRKMLLNRLMSIILTINDKIKMLC